jgi:DNA-binding FrmR family transcriptional regulator
MTRNRNIKKGVLSVKMKKKYTKSKPKNTPQNTLDIVDNNNETDDNTDNLNLFSSIYLKKDILNDLELRLKKIEGQIKGVQGMLKSHKNCDDIIIQIMAVKSALNSVAIKLIEEHIQRCIRPAIKNNNYLILDSLLNSIEKIFKEVK